MSLHKSWTVEGGGVRFVKVDNVIIWIGENTLLVGVVVAIFVAWAYWDSRKHLEAEEKIKRDKGVWRGSGSNLLGGADITHCDNLDIDTD